MSYPRLASPGDTPLPTQAEIDAASRRRAADALTRALDRLVRAAGRDWPHCIKAACRRSRRCRSFACEHLDLRAGDGRR